MELRPKIQQLLGKYPEISSYFVDVNKYPDIAAACSIFTIPGILFFIEGKEFIREARHISIVKLEEKIDRYYAMLFS